MTRFSASKGIMYPAPPAGNGEADGEAATDGDAVAPEADADEPATADD